MPGSRPCRARRQRGFPVPRRPGQSLYEAIGLLGGTIDILVNNAGIQRRIPAEDFPLDQWDEVLRGQPPAVLRPVPAGVSLYKAKGYGKIINLGSLNSFRSVAQNIAAYQAAKSGIHQLCRALADEWSEFGIRVNGIAPGWTGTDLTAAVVQDKEKYARTLQQIPLGRWATPEDYKGLAILLASPAGDFINGTMTPVDGGCLSR
jgi:2-deoxy-D-gluconate 3-dehydrogenase